MTKLLPAAVIFLTTCAQAVIIRPLPPAGRNCVPLAVSNGGTFVAGFAQTSPGQARAYRWDAAGFTDLGDPPHSVFYEAILPQAISDDGSVIAGRYTSSLLHGGGSAPFRWDTATGMTAPVLPGGTTSAFAAYVSGDGQFIVGHYTIGSTATAVSWDTQGNLQTYAPALGHVMSEAMAASDGLAVVVGDTFEPSGANWPARWTQPPGPAQILPIISGNSSAHGVSADGAVIVGSSGTLPVRWLSVNNYAVEVLPLPEGYPSGTTMNVSANGNVILGNCWNSEDLYGIPVLWVGGRLVPLRPLLISYGVDPSLANALNATAMSRDGYFITAYTMGPSDSSLPYLIELPHCGAADFDCDGNIGTDADIEAFFRCIAGDCPPPPCTSTADFDHDGDSATDADIEAFFRALANLDC